MLETKLVFSERVDSALLELSLPPHIYFSASTQFRFQWNYLNITVLGSQIGNEDFGNEKYGGQPVWHWRQKSHKFCTLCPWKRHTVIHQLVYSRGKARVQAFEFLLRVFPDTTLPFLSGLSAELEVSELSSCDAQALNNQGFAGSAALGQLLTSAVE